MQYVKGALNVQEYVYDFSVDGGAISAIDLSAKNGKSVLPNGAIVKTVYAKVITQCTSGGAATIEWGNTTDPNGYSGATVAVGSLTADAIFNGWDNAAAQIWDDVNDHPIYFVANSANDRDFLITIAGDTLTAGKIAFSVEYYLPAVDQ